jgi:hypothetical protein
MMSMDYPAHTFVSLFYDGDAPRRRIGRVAL